MEHESHSALSPGDPALSMWPVETIRESPGLVADWHVSGIRPVVEAARRSQSAWAERPLPDRLRAIRRLRHLIAEQSGALARVAGRAEVRNVAEAMVAEVLPLADACRFLERWAGRLLCPRHLGIGGRPAWLWGSWAEVWREPVGLVLVIGPSNYPLMLPGVQAIQALVAGNAVLWKPGDGGGPAARMLASLIASVGIDPALVAILPESAAAARASIVAGVDRVVQTGSVAAGRAVLEQLAPKLVPATLELSGCDPCLVLEDADLELAARSLAFSLRFNGGATCIAPRRVFVPESLAPELERRLLASVSAIPSRRLEPLEMRRIAPLVGDAVEHGARLIAGQAFDGGELIGPLVLGGVPPEARLMHEDPFGPLLALVPVGDEEEAVRRAADCPYARGRLDLRRTPTRPGTGGSGSGGRGADQ